MKIGFMCLTCFVFCCSSGCAQGHLPPPQPVAQDDPKGVTLPLGIPRMIDRNGNVISMNHRFTTPQYTEAARQLLLQEANRVADELRLSDEVLPITKSNVKELYVSPFGFSYIRKSIGVVTTSNYVYRVTRANKFSGLVVADYDEVCLKIRESSSRSVSQMDSNWAHHSYQLATQWLAAVSMDVHRLNRDCKVHIAFSPFWNGLSKLGQNPRNNSVPIYYVWWTSPKNDAEGSGGAASVELCLPTKKILQLSVDDPTYILRKPLVFTNLNSLFPGTGRITVLTNYDSSQP